MPRPYSSELRAQRSAQTRATVVAAAHDLFLEQGWVATTMAQVATRAGVARQTVYLLFDGKLALLDACIVTALNEGRGVPVRELPEYRRMAAGGFDDRVRAGAAWLAGAHRRSAAIQRVLDEAAVTDPAAAARLAERERTRWQEVRWATGLVLADPDPDDAVVDAIWTLGSRDVWFKLVSGRGWTSKQWEQWFVDALAVYRDRAADVAAART